MTLPMMTRLLLPLLLLGLGACGEAGPSTTGDPGQRAWTPTAPPKKGANTGNLGKTVGRLGRRMSVDQVKASVEYLFPGITWTGSSRTVRNEFQRLSRTLGKADYINLTRNMIEPNMLFMKYMDDMAGQVCKKAIAHDQGEPTEAKRMFVRYPKDIDKNLRFVRLKFHGIYVPETSTASITGLAKLYSDILAATRDSKRAWEGVCVAVLTAPEFFAY